MARRNRLAWWGSLALTPAILWAAMVLVWAGAPGGQTPLWRVVMAIVWLTAVVVALRRLRARTALGVCALLWLPVGLFFVTLSPSNERDWEAPSSRTAWARVEGGQVTLHNIRDFRYAPDGAWTEAWYDATFDLHELEESFFVLTEFGGIDGLAHVMVSFRFAGDRFVVLSVEIRRQVGETYNPIGGAFRQYELFYVAADERDAVALRTLVHGDPTWVIPMRAGREKTAAFFLDMVERMNALRLRPAWYNTLTSSCATNLATHYERVNQVRLGLDLRIFLPGFSDQLLEELGLLPEGVDRARARDRFLVNERARMDDNSACFSLAIRGEVPPGGPCPSPR